LGKADLRLVAALFAPLLKSLASASASELISFGEAVLRASLARKTLYEWKRTGKLRRAHGRPLAAHRMVRLQSAHR
jgi:hypothetical protein